jgi:hypothetical protein
MAIETGFIERDNSGLPHIIGMGPNSGGVGKSANGKVVASLALAAGLRVLLADFDPGLGSLTKSVRPDLYSVVEIPRTAEELRNLVPFFVEKAVGHDVVVVDLGANFMATTVISMPFRSALRELKGMGWRTSMVVSTMVGKDGMLDDAPNFASQFSPVAQPYIACRGWQMDRLPEVMRMLVETYPSWSMPPMQVAALTDMAERGLLPIDYARTKPNDFTRAAAMVAQTLFELAREPAVKQLLGAIPDLQGLASLAADSPSRWFTGKVARWQICNSVLDAEERFLLAEHKLRGLSNQAIETQLRDLHGAWQSCWHDMLAAHQEAQVAHD